MGEPFEKAGSIAGHCLCGKVGIALHGVKPEVEVCQCSMCRRWGGAFYSGLSGESFEVSGEEHIAIYRSSEWAERAFCMNCGSNLWYRFLPTGSRSFLAGLFEAASSYPVEREIFADEAASWCRLAGDHPRLTGADVVAEAKAAGFELG